jgi:hypothetical protein
MIALPIASAMAPSLPGFGHSHSSERPAVLDSRTSSVTSFAPLSKRPRMMRLATWMAPWCAS